MAVLLTDGRVAMVESLTTRPIYMAWGAGLPLWDTAPEPEPIYVKTLVAEIGRRKLTSWRYCTPDPAGEIAVPEGRFRESTEPTNHLYLRFAFDFADGAGASLREVGVFVGGQTDVNLPPGQLYFTPDQVVDPGRMLLLERIPKLDRLASVRQTFEFVITI